MNMVKKFKVVESVNIHTGKTCPVGHVCYPDVQPLVGGYRDDRVVYVSSTPYTVRDGLSMVQCDADRGFDAKAWAMRWIAEANMGSPQKPATVRLGDFLAACEEDGIKLSITTGIDLTDPAVLDLQVYPTAAPDTKLSSKDEIFELSTVYKIDKVNLKED